MNFKEYSDLFDTILQRADHAQTPPYDNPHYLEYVKLNQSRMQRWFKTGQLTPAFRTAIQNIDAYQHWIIITEAWCGDASHSIPFMEMAAQLNPLIRITYELRDIEPFRINEYLTNNGRSIPKLIIRNASGYDLGTWGPRPAECQALYLKLKAENVDYDTQKIELQRWYNTNKGKDIMDELTALVTR